MPLLLSLILLFSFSFIAKKVLLQFYVASYINVIVEYSLEKTGLLLSLILLFSFSFIAKKVLLQFYMASCINVIVQYSLEKNGLLYRTENSEPYLLTQLPCGCRLHCARGSIR
jgi:hypothetical protein